jgi:hypothetical protein
MLPASNIRRRRVYKLSAVLMIVAATCVAAAGAKAWLSRPAPAAATLPAPQGNSAQEEPEAEVVALLPTGFEPRQITRPRGRFLLVVKNRTGLEQVEWRLDREAGGRLREVRLSEGKLGSSQYEDLPPGTYVLTEAGHPDWECRVTITPN